MKRISVLILFLIMIISISAVNATDNISSDLKTTDNVLSLEDEIDSLYDGDDDSFSDLNTIISNADEGSVLNLTKNYTFNKESDNDYTDGVEISKAVTIDGQGYTIDASDSARIFKITADNVILKNILFKNGKADNGAAIYSAKILTVENSQFVNNTAVQSGGAIYNDAGTLYVSGSVFDGNDLTDRTKNGWGGAAIYSNGGALTITESNITNNLKDIVHRGGTGSYTGDLSSAAVASENGVLNVTSSYFSNNSGSYGGAILSNGADAILNVDNSTFENNFAFNGGAIDFAGNTYTITNSTFKSNNVKGTGSSNTNYAQGGAICTQDKTWGLISNCVFEDNTAAIGGAISNKLAKIINCNFTNNTAYSSNSELFNGKANNRGGFGGAVYNDGNISIEESSFIDNIGRGRGLDLKNADIITSSFTNTIINVNNKGIINEANNTFYNDGADISSTSNCVVYIGEGNIPKVKNGEVYYTGNSFTGLLDLINSEITSTICLSNDISKLEDEYGLFADGILVNRSVSINAKNHTITSNNGKIFTVNEGVTLSLSNAEVVGDGTCAIVNNGQVTASILTFSNAGEYPIENNGVVYETVTNFTQLNDLISLVSGGVVYIGSSKITKSDEEKELFKEGIVINRSLTVKGWVNTKGVIGTYINASNDGRIFNITDGATLNLINITLSKGNADVGGAIYVCKDSSLVTEFTNFTASIAAFGGAVYSEGTLNINNSSFIDNTAGVGGGAIYSTSLTDVENSLFKNNKVTNNHDNGGSQGGAIAVVASQLNVSGSDFIENSANPDSWGIGGAIYVNESGVFIRNSNFEKNKGFFAGAVFLENINQEIPAIDNCTFNENKGLQGGAINIQTDTSGFVSINASKFIQNSAYSTGTGTTWNDGASGGAIQAANGDVALKITDSVFTNNSVSSPNSNAAFGGAIYVAGNLTVDNSEFSENTVSASTIGIGSAIAAGGNNTVTGISNTVINNNAAARAALYLWYNTANIDNVNFTNNIANTENGGALYYYGNDNGELTVTGSIFKNNDAAKGGALYIRAGNVCISKSYFENNKAESEYNIHNEGNLSLSESEFAFINAEINVSDIVFGNDALINGTFDAGINELSNITLLLDNDKKGSSKLSDNGFSFVVSDLSAGSYKISFADENNNKFILNESIDSEFEVLKGDIDINLTIEVINATYPVQAIVNISTNVSGKYIVSAGDKNYTVEVEEGVISQVTVDVLAVGEYDVAVSYDNENYTKSVAGKLIISKGEYSINVAVANTTYPNQAVISVNSTASGNVIVSVDGKEYSVEVEKGVISQVTVDVLDVGEYDVTVTHDDSENYTASTFEDKLIISKGDISLEITIDDVNYPNVPVAFVHASVDANYTLTVGENTYYVIVENGYGNATLDNLAINEYTANVSYADDNYNPAENTTTFNINKGIVDITVLVINAVYPKQAVVMISSDVDGEYVVCVDGNNHTVDISSGEYRGFKVGLLGAGVYNVTVNYAETEYYSEKTVENELIISTLDNVIIVKIEDTTLPNIPKVLVNASVDGNYTLTVGDNDYIVVVVNNTGEIALNDLKVNDNPYTALLSFNNTNYTTTQNSTTFKYTKIKVNPTINIPGLVAGESKDVTVILPDNATGNITVNVDNTILETFNIAGGSAVVAIPGLSVGSHNIVISYAGDDLYSGFTKTYNTTIKSLAKITENKAVSAYYDDGSVYKVRVYGDDGKVLSGVKVTFNVNGKTASVKTDSKGYASYRIDLTPGTYTIKASYAKLSVSNKIKVNQIIKVKSTTSVKKSAKSLSIKITLKGKSVYKNKKITVKFNGKKYNIKTNSKGVAVFKLAKNVIKKLKTKKYSYTVAYSKDVVKAYVSVKK